MPELPGHDRREQRRLERRLDDDEPGAPPGYLLDPDDTRSHEPIADRLDDDDEGGDDAAA